MKNEIAFMHYTLELKNKSADYYPVGTVLGLVRPPLPHEAAQTKPKKRKWHTLSAHITETVTGTAPTKTPSRRGSAGKGPGQGSANSAKTTALSAFGSMQFLVKSCVGKDGIVVV